MMTFLTVLQVLACIVVVASVLLQPAKGDGNPFGGSSQTMMGNSGGTHFLFKATMACALFLAASSLFMSWQKIREGGTSVMDQLAVPMTPSTTTPVAPSTAPPGSSTTN